MKQLLLLSLLLLFLACADVEPLPSDPLDAARIEGRWQAQPPAHPLWIYEFNYPHLRQWIVDFGVVITEQEYIYAPKGDTLFVSGAGGQRKWLLYFPSDSVCEYRAFTSIHLSPVYRLHRIQ